MARTAGGGGGKNRAGQFFLATLVLWLVSIVFEILFNRRTELLCVICGGCFFQLANWVVRSWLSRDPLFVNTSISLFHSIITSASGPSLSLPLSLSVLNSLGFFNFAYVLSLGMNEVLNLMLRILCEITAHINCFNGSDDIVIFILVNQWLTKGLGEMFVHSELFGGTWQWAYPALCLSCGYFAYDQWDMLQYRLYRGLIPSILVHHFVLLVCFTLALYRNVTINYLILTLICELHSIFLHVRKLRRMAGIRDASTAMAKLEWGLNWFTFVFARCVPHVLITIKLIQDASKFRKGVELPLALLGMAGLNFLNASLGVDLLHAFIREMSSRINRQSDHHNHGE